jgi:hypothetical protein
MTQDEQNKRIKALCKAKGIKFKPWEFPPPWDITDEQETPHPTLKDCKWWPQMVAIRRKLKAEILSEQDE